MSSHGKAFTEIHVCYLLTMRIMLRSGAEAIIYDVSDNTKLKRLIKEMCSYFIYNCNHNLIRTFGRL